MTHRLTGGCQCGAVRFSVDPSALRTASVCHCRMCQKAFGGFYAPLVSVEPSGLTWTRGERALFRSSNVVSRGFCAACGTPLTYEPDGEEPALAIGAFDEPARIPPTIQYGTESKLPYADAVPALKARTTESTVDAAPFLAGIVSRQHPDHDTAEWPPESET
jgi:hypothetical protein